MQKLNRTLLRIDDDLTQLYNKHEETDNRINDIVKQVKNLTDKEVRYINNIFKL